MSKKKEETTEEVVEKECNCEECHCEDCNDSEDEELLVKRIEVLENELLRTKADSINYKKRLDKEVDSFKKYANEGLIKELLDVVDNLERAIKMDDNDLTDDLSKMLEGFKMTYSELTLKLEKFGVSVVNPVNEKFDPSYHQALLSEQVEDMDADIVIEVLQKGYLLHDRLLRPAMVKVSI